jgi:hypothetical protein
LLQALPLPKREGYLWKQGSVIKKFKKRWCRTNGRYLHVFKAVSAPSLSLCPAVAHNVPDPISTEG